MSDQLAIYQLNAQSADKLDERRDATTRAHGGLCIVVATAAVGAWWQHYPAISAVLWLFLVVVALGWLATLDSLTAKLTAKSKLLTRMEEDGLVPLQFLTEERKQWKSLKNKPLQRALKCAPIAFLVLGAGAFLGALALVFSSAAVSQ